MKQELIGNKYITVNEDLYDNYKQQAKIKVYNHSH